MSTVNDCLTDILSWTSTLKLNVDNTDIIITGTKQQRNKTVDYFPVKILGNDTSPSDTVRNLGVVFDSNCSFPQVCKSRFYHIRDFRRIRRHLSLSSAKPVSVALINSRLDYYNSFINNLAKKTYLNSNVYRIV